MRSMSSNSSTASVPCGGFICAWIDTMISSPSCSVTRLTTREFDVLLCADADVLYTVRAHAPPEATAHTELLLDWCGLGPNAQIPDPYTLNAAAFEHAWELVDSAAEAIVKGFVGR